MPITNNVANQHREETCIAITSERKCFHPGNSFVKRSLRPFEWQLYSYFEDDQAVVLVIEYVDGVGINELDDAQRKIVKAELEQHLETLQGLRSSRIGDDWSLQQSVRKEYVFYHNDLSQRNVVVDPVLLKISATLYWEYAGFFPTWFERRFFERIGPLVAKDGEDMIQQESSNSYRLMLYVAIDPLSLVCKCDMIVASTIKDVGRGHFCSDAGGDCARVLGNKGYEGVG
ncbi:hypothetical protein SMMN14_01024 [Sphaerulina musiva]